MQWAVDIGVVLKSCSSAIGCLKTGDSTADMRDMPNEARAPSSSTTHQSPIRHAPKANQLSSGRDTATIERRCPTRNAVGATAAASTDNGTAESLSGYQWTQ